MADIDRRDGKYIARWRDQDGRQRSKSFGRKLDATRFLANVKADLARGTYIDPRAGALTLAEYANERWLPAQLHLRPNTATLYASHLSHWVVPLLGSRRIGSIRRSDVKGFVAALSAKLEPSTVATVYAVLRALMQSAADDGLIPASPCSRVPLPRAARRVVTPIPAGAVLALAEAITPRYELAVWLAAGAGLREGEALGLTVPRVDFLRRRIHVLEQMQNRVLSPPKTRASRRVIPVDDLVLDKITAHMQRWKPGPEQLLITNRLGGPVQRNSFGYCWRDAAGRAGLQGTRFHDLRHFYASVLIAAGLHPKVIQARLGHATIAETMDTYGHLFPDAEEMGRGAFDAALGNGEAQHACQGRG